MENLGFDPQAIDRIVVNPKNPCADDLNVYFEMRTSKQIEGYTLSGKFDLVVAGCVHDIKTTKAYTYQNGSNDEKYRMQGSIYRWLNPELITQNSIIVDYYFTDWNPVSYAKEKDKNYPPNRMLAKSFQLISISATESFIRAQLKKIRELTNKSQDELPRCTPEELWQKPSCWEYWSKAENKQCSKLLDSKADAEAWLASKGVGFIRERQGQPTFCKYCDAQTICRQAQEFVNQGLLVI